MIFDFEWWHVCYKVKATDCSDISFLALKIANKPINKAIKYY